MREGLSVIFGTFLVKNSYGQYTSMRVERRHRREDPGVSVVIPTYPGSDHDRVCELLEAEQTLDGFEIVVVNDGDLDICEARNVGIERAEAPVVALTDDDVNPPIDWLSVIERTFAGDRGLGLLEGPVRGGINYDGTGVYVGCNLAFRRDAALAIGGFDTAYAGWRDDTEFGWRMERDSECAVAFEPEMRMSHPPYARAGYIQRNEERLRRQYPRRYEQRLNDSVGQRLWRLGMRTRVLPYINRLRNASH